MLENTLAFAKVHRGEGTGKEVAANLANGKSTVEVAKFQNWNFKRLHGFLAYV